MTAPLFSPPLTSPPGSGVPPPASSSPSPVLAVSRGVCGQGERAPPPQAVVKPNVLTHLIEGFVIQEGAEPFPVSTWDFLVVYHFQTHDMYDTGHPPFLVLVLVYG